MGTCEKKSKGESLLYTQKLKWVKFMDTLLFLLIIFLPGYLLLKLFFGRYDAIIILPVSFVLGLLLLLLSVLPSYIFQLDFSVSILIIISYTALLLLLALRRGTLNLRLEFSLDYVLVNLLILVIGSTVLMFFINPNFTGDALFHLGQIRILTENNPVSPNEAFFPIEAINPAYGYNVWYFAVALISFISKIDVTTVWSHLIFILVPVSILSLYAFALGVFKDRMFALVSSVIYVFILGYVGNAWEFRLMPYPDQIARHIVLFVALYFFIQFIRERRRVYFILTVLTAFLLTTIHLFSWVHFLLAVGAFGSLGFVLGLSAYFKDSLKVIAATIILSAPYLALKLQSAGTVLGSVDLKRDAVSLTYRIFFINPLAKGPIFIFAALALLYLIFLFRKTLRKHLWLIFIASSAFAGAFIMFNPVAAPIVSRLITYTYMHRLGSLFYKELILTAFLFFVLIGAKRKLKLDKMFQIIITIIVIFVVLAIPVNYNENIRIGDKDEVEAKKVIKFLETSTNYKSVFAADMWTSYRIGAYSNNYIVATFPSHMTSNVSKPTRIENLKSIFSSDVSLEDTKELLNKYNVSFIVVINKPRNNDILIDQEKFVGKRDFKEIYSGNNYKIYSYEKGGT